MIFKICILFIFGVGVPSALSPRLLNIMQLPRRDYHGAEAEIDLGENDDGAAAAAVMRDLRGDGHLLHLGERNFLHDNLHF
jgi:hypothetical protein